MLVIRLIRTGKKNASSFRVILTEKTSAPKSGKFLEILGSYNPRLTDKDGKKEITLKKDRIEYWLSQGAQASDTVHNLLVNEGVIKGPKIKKNIGKKTKKNQAGADSEKPKAEEESLGKKEEVTSNEKSEKEQESASDKKEQKSASKKKEPVENKSAQEAKTSSESVSEEKLSTNKKD